MNKLRKLKKLRLSPTLGALAVTLFLGSEVGVAFYFISLIAGSGPLRLVAYAGVLLATLWFCVAFFWRTYVLELKLHARERRKAQHGNTVVA